jgi:hypothetical protein
MEGIAARLEHGDAVTGGFEDSRKMLAVFLDGMRAGTFFRIGESATHRYGKTPHIAFQDIIGSAFTDGFDGTFFTDGAGQEDERHMRLHFAHDFQSLDAIELRHRVIRDHDLGHGQFEDTPQTGLRFHLIP